MKVDLWIKRQIAEVDQDGRHVVEVKLCAVDGAVHDTWSAAYIKEDIERFCDETKAIQADLASELPRGAVQLEYLAFDQRGEVRSRCIVSIQGTNHKGSRSLVDGGQQAQANAMGAIAQTMERTLATANAQLEHLSRTNETQSKHLVECYEFIRRKMETDAIEAGQRAATVVPDELQQMAIEHGPKVLELLSLLLEKKPKPAPNGAGTPNTDPAQGATSNGAN